MQFFPKLDSHPCDYMFVMLIVGLGINFEQKQPGLHHWNAQQSSQISFEGKFCFLSTSLWNDKKKKKQDKLKNFGIFNFYVEIELKETRSPNKFKADPVHFHVTMPFQKKYV